MCFYAALYIIFNSYYYYAECRCAYLVNMKRYSFRLLIACSYNTHRDYFNDYFPGQPGLSSCPVVSQSPVILISHSIRGFLKTICDSINPHFTYLVYLLFYFTILSILSSLDKLKLFIPSMTQSRKVYLKCPLELVSSVSIRRMLLDQITLILMFSIPYSMICPLISWLTGCSRGNSVNSVFFLLSFDVM